MLHACLGRVALNIKNWHVASLTNIIVQRSTHIRRKKTEATWQQTHKKILLLSIMVKRGRLLSKDVEAQKWVDIICDATFVP